MLQFCEITLILIRLKKHLMQEPKGFIEKNELNWPVSIWQIYFWNGQLKSIYWCVDILEFVMNLTEERQTESNI